MRALALLLVLVGACTEPPPKQPDIVLVVVDTLRADHLGAYGYTRPTSPNIDALAAKGAVFTRAYSQAGWTLASFASLLTGLYPATHRAVRDNANPTQFGVVSRDITTLAESLSAAGYATAAFLNNPFLTPEFNLNQGFDVYDFVDADYTQHRSAHDTVKLGLAWMDKQTKPSFLLLHFMEPHIGYDPAADVRGTFAPVADPPVPVPFLGKGFSRHGPEPEPKVRDYIIALYDEEVLAADKAVGELVAGLDQRKAWRKTTLVFTADHGEEFWDHGGFEHGHTLYSELVHVPLIIAGLGAPSGRFDTLVESVDLFQGILARAGAVRPPGSVGADLWTFATPTPVRGRYALSESVIHGGEMASITDENTRLVVALDSRMMEAWQVDPDCAERQKIDEQAAHEIGRPLFRELFARRGGMDPIAPDATHNLTSNKTVEQLRALGYIDDPAEGTSTP